MNPSYRITSYEVVCECGWQTDFKVRRHALAHCLKHRRACPADLQVVTTKTENFPRDPALNP